MTLDKIYGFKSKIVAGALIAGAFFYPIQNTYAQTNPGKLSELAKKNVVELTLEEKRTIIERLVSIESQGDPNAVNRVVRQRTIEGKVVEDTIYSVGEGQINISSSGALEDYNQFHDPDFTPQDMLNPEKNRTVRDWYLWTRIPELLNTKGLETTVANIVASYNTGAERLKKRGGDAIEYFKRLPRITRNYLKKILGEED
jgi:hypothetical protein